MVVGRLVPSACYPTLSNFGYIIGSRSSSPLAYGAIIALLLIPLVMPNYSPPRLFVPPCPHPLEYHAIEFHWDQFGWILMFMGFVRCCNPPLLNDGNTTPNIIPPCLKLLIRRSSFKSFST